MFNVLALAAVILVGFIAGIFAIVNSGDNAKNLKVTQTITEISEITSNLRAKFPRGVPNNTQLDNAASLADGILPSSLQSGNQWGSQTVIVGRGGASGIGLASIYTYGVPPADCTDLILSLSSVLSGTPPTVNVINGAAVRNVSLTSPSVDSDAKNACFQGGSTDIVEVIPPF